MKKTKELEIFEALTTDPDEKCTSVKVVFLDEKLLKMADDFKNENLRNNTGISRNTPTLADMECQ